MAKWNLYLKTVSVEETFDKYYSTLKEKGILDKFVEEIPIYDALGRVTSEAIFNVIHLFLMLQ